MRGRAALGAILVLGLAAPASAAGVRAEVAAGADPARYRTFAWKETSAILPPDAHRAFQEAGAEELTAKGLKAVPASEAEVIFSYKLLATAEEDVKAYGYADPSTWATDQYGGTAVYGYVKGKVAVYAEERGSGALVWTAEGEANVKDAPGAVKKVRRLAAKMFKSWPTTRGSR